MVVHTHDYKDYHGYDDKRVVVVGIGNSGGDVAVELSRIASQVGNLQYGYFQMVLFASLIVALRPR